jgi:hypothetical protein
MAIRSTLRRLGADRSIEPGSGEERFDLTPPAGLPPPPAR